MRALMLRATFLIGSRRLRRARLTRPSGKQPAQWYDLYSHNAGKLSFSRYGPHRLQAVLEQFVQPRPLLVRQVLRPLQEAPAAVRQHRLVALAGQFLGLGRPHLVDGLVQPGHDVEPGQDVQRVPGLLGDDLQIRLPHVAADELQDGGALAAEHPEEPQQRLGRPFLPDPQEPRTGAVDLVHHRQVAVTLLELHFVDADGRPSQSVLRFHYSSWLAPFSVAMPDRIRSGGRQPVMGLRSLAPLGQDRT